MTLLTIAEAGILTGFSATLLKKLTKYAPKAGEDRKLKCKRSDGMLLFKESELLSFKKYLSQPWPRPKAGPRARSCQEESAGGPPPARAIIPLNALATFASKSDSIW
jgi:hypothetical protein